MKHIILIVMFIFLIIILVLCINNVDSNSKVTKVKQMPIGYISIKDVERKYSFISYGFFESVIYFQDLDKVTVKQTTIDNEKILVQYNNEIYINEQYISEALEKAKDTAKKREMVYNLGDEITLYDRELQDIIIILNGVTYTENLYGISPNDAQKFCIINIVVLDNSNSTIKVNKYFDRAETSVGGEIKDFIEISESTVAFQLPDNEKATYIFVKSPFYNSNIRKVDVSVEGN